jgi:hypothetical protein
MAKGQGLFLHLPFLSGGRPNNINNHRMILLLFVMHCLRLLLSGCMGKRSRRNELISADNLGSRLASIIITAPSSPFGTSTFFAPYWGPIDDSLCLVLFGNGLGGRVRER